MMKTFSTSLAALTLALSVLAQKCPLQFDGRVAKNATAASLDASTSPFSPNYVFGKGLTLSQIALLPTVTPSLFDSIGGTKAIEVTIDDKSIFTPSSTNVQIGFRRAELLPASNNGTDPSTTGVKTIHFSIMKDTARPLNTSHEYQLFFLESSDYSTNQVVLKTGTLLGGSASQDPNALIVVGNVNASPVQTLFTVSFAAKVWHNFGITLDFNARTTQVLYSTGAQPLVAKTNALSNDVSGQGQFHFGVLKKPTGSGLTDLAHQGFQEAGINEGIIYGGIFEEDSTGGCVSLSP